MQRERGERGREREIEVTNNQINLSTTIKLVKRLK